MCVFVQDISYYCCKQVAGSRQAIIECLKPLFHAETGKLGVGGGSP